MTEEGLLPVDSLIDRQLFDPLFSFFLQERSLGNLEQIILQKATFREYDNPPGQFTNKVIGEFSNIYGFVCEAYVKMRLEEYSETHASFDHFKRRNFRLPNGIEFRFNKFGNLTIYNGGETLAELDGLWEFKMMGETVPLIIEISPDDPSNSYRKPELIDHTYGRKSYLTQFRLSITDTKFGVYTPRNFPYYRRFIIPKPRDIPKLVQKLWVIGFYPTK